MSTQDVSIPGLSPIRFSDHVQEQLSAERRSHLESLANELGPWTQGPFLLGGDLIVGEDRRSDSRWEGLKQHVPDTLSGKRVLVLGSEAGYDAFMFHLLGAEFVLACEPSDRHRQAAFLESVYKTGIAFRRLGWQDLAPEHHGVFDVIHCRSVHRELSPVLMLGRLQRLLAFNGSALIGGPMLAEPEASEYLRFVQEHYDGDPGWWWIPGPSAMRRMLRTAGFDPGEDFYVDDDLSRRPGLKSGYFAASAAGEVEQLYPVAAQTARFADAPDRVVARSAYPAGHFYSSVPDVRQLAAEPTHSRVWPDTPHPTPGIDWRGDAQAELCTKVFAEQVPLEFPTEATDDPHEYFVKNQQLSALDAWILQAILRHAKPSQMIEIGSGYSSLVSARVNREFLGGEMRFTCIEPYPRPFLLEGIPGVTDLRVEEVQDTPLEVFDELGAGDVLFVDTSHTVKTGGEVPWLFSQVIPRLAPGVLVHVHDIYLPGEYPQQWILDEGRNWAENYLVEAFLSFNAGFDVLFGTQWMIQNHPDALLEAFPGLIDVRKLKRPMRPPEGYFLLSPHSGSSLWLQRVSAGARR